MCLWAPETGRIVGTDRIVPDVRVKISPGTESKRVFIYEAPSRGIEVSGG